MSTDEKFYSPPENRVIDSHNVLLHVHISRDVHSFMDWRRMGRAHECMHRHAIIFEEVFPKGDIELKKI